MDKKFDITQFNPCLRALEWYESQPSTKKAWKTCPRGDWMLWIASKVGVDRQLLALATGHCAQTVIHLMKDYRSKNAIKAIIAYGQGKITKEELNDTAAAAAAVADVAAAAAAADADVAAAAAAAAAITAADTAVADVAAAAAAVADVAAADRIKNQLQTADICRKYLTEAFFKAIGETDA